MTKTLCTLLLMSTLCGVAHAQPAAPPTRRFWNPTLGWLGIVTMASGGALMVPWHTDVGAHDYELFGEDRCIIDDRLNRRFDIQDHPCAASTPRIKAGLITLAVGGGMALVGFRRVTVAPRLGAQTVGASVSVKW